MFSQSNNKYNLREVRMKTDIDASENQPETKTGNTWKENIYHIMKQFFSNTTAHGYGSLLSSDNAVIRCFWIAIIIGSYSYLIINIRDLYQLYTEKPQISRQSISNAVELNYPTILLCNLNPVKSSLISNLLVNLTEGNFTMNEKLTNEWNFQIQYSELAKRYGKDIQNFSQSSSEFIAECSWRFSDDCRNDWRPFWNWRYGMCFAFNSLEDNSTLSIRAAGWKSSLHVKLFLNSEEFLLPISTKSGARLFIGEQGTYFEPEFEGYGLAAGMNNEVRIKPYKVKRLDPFQIGKCQKRDIRDTKVEFQNITKYTQSYCRNLCYAESNLKYCNCTSADYSISFKNICSYDQYECFEITPDPTNCLDSCTPPCDEIKYVTTISTEKSQLHHSEMAAYDIASLHIFFEGMAMDLWEEKLIYTTGDFISGIGGLFGLFSGFSLMTFIEIIVLFCTFMVCSIKTCFRR